MTPEIAQHLKGTAWMVDPAALERFVASVSSIDVTAADVARGSQSSEPYAIDGDTAVIRIGGLMMRPVPPLYRWIGAILGMEFTDIDEVREALARAVEDQDVKAIRLSIDSPGGTVSGLESLAGDVAAARGLKPIVAAVDGLMASAALYVGVQADTVTAHKGDMIGSIGTFAVLHDSSAMYEDAGVKVHLISSHPGKGAADGAPVTEEYLQGVREMVAGYSAQFVAAVAKGRDMPMADARALATGKVWLAPEAKRLGLIDSVVRDGRAKSTAKTTTAATASAEEIVMQDSITKAQADAAAEKERADALAEENARLKAEQESIKATIEAAVAQQREDIMNRYPERVTAENREAVAKYGAFCKDDLAAFEGHIKSLPQVTRPDAIGDAGHDPEQRRAPVMTAEQREICRIFGAKSWDQIEKLGARGNSFALDGTVFLADKSFIPEDKIDSFVSGQFQPYAAEDYGFIQ